MTFLACQTAADYTSAAMMELRQVWVVAEHQAGQIADVTQRLLAEGARLAELLHDELVLILLGVEAESVRKAAATYGPDVLYIVEAHGLSSLDGEACASAVAACIRSFRPRVVLLTDTPFGADVAARAAAVLGLGIAPACSGLVVRNGQIAAFRRVYDGRFQVTVELRDSAPFLATLTPRLAEYPPVAASARRRMTNVVMVPVNLAESRVRPLRLMPGDPRALDLREADVIVAGGRGIGSRENLQLLNELADAMQGVVACSRPLVDAGWLPRDRLVGQSGRQVAPRLYIACGISGATQHLMGMRGSQFVVAINSDPHSPIFKAADVGVVGDLGQVIPALTRKALEARRAGLAPAEVMGTSLAEG